MMKDERIKDQGRKEDGLPRDSLMTVMALAGREKLMYRDMASKMMLTHEPRKRNDHQ